ncbi:acyltransferase domain-containing protein [Nonomuraea sp. NPDC049158]|uniref:acyltransferase domain-containing protein n=1 Tax=Nonomuraea sp. NPDC049158 TaxID=3155649 RepID=UPI0033CFF655
MDRPVALLFPGQGAQQAQMAKGLFEHDPVFTEEMVRACRAMGEVGQSLLDDWLSESPEVGVDATLRSQPLLYAVGYALGRMVRSWGVRPSAVLGHSVGELVAAVIAGVFEPDAAARVCWRRLAPLLDAPQGGMLAVAAAPGDIARFLTGGVEVAAYNAPRQVILSGPWPALSATVEALTEAGITCRPVASQTPFHNSLLAAPARATTGLFAALEPRPPRIPLYSTRTGALLDGRAAADPEFWSMQAATPVLFWQAIEALLQRDGLVLVEAGPGQMLSRLARRHPKVRAGNAMVVPLLPVRSGDPAQDRLTAHEARDALGSFEAAQR